MQSTSCKDCGSRLALAVGEEQCRWCQLSFELRRHPTKAFSYLKVSGRPKSEDLSELLTYLGLPLGTEWALLHYDGVTFGEEWRGYDVALLGLRAVPPSTRPEGERWVTVADDSLLTMQLCWLRVFRRGVPMYLERRWAPVRWIGMSMHGLLQPHTVNEEQDLLRGQGLIECVTREPLSRANRGRKPGSHTSWGEPETFRRAVGSAYWAHVEETGDAPEQQQVADALRPAIGLRTLQRRLGMWSIPWPPENIPPSNASNYYADNLGI